MNMKSAFVALLLAMCGQTAFAQDNPNLGHLNQLLNQFDSQSSWSQPAPASTMSPGSPASGFATQPLPPGGFAAGPSGGWPTSQLPATGPLRRYFQNTPAGNGQTPMSITPAAIFRSLMSGNSSGSSGSSPKYDPAKAANASSNEQVAVNEEDMARSAAERASSGGSSYDRQSAAEEAQNHADAARAAADSAQAAAEGGSEAAHDAAAQADNAANEAQAAADRAKSNASGNGW